MFRSRAWGLDVEFRVQPSGCRILGPYPETLVQGLAGFTRSPVAHSDSN